ncbi:MAG: flagellar hook assembly protein FlgD [Legionellales bacterium]
MTEPVQATNLGQEDYMKLFMQELTYQDPLKPVDNREFMAQMAQFSALSEAKSSNEALSQLLGMTSASQSLSLLGKHVKIRNAEGLGTVNFIEFFEKKAPELAVYLEKGGYAHVDLNQISEVQI